MFLEYYSKINISLGIIVLICFFLPWISIDCGNTSIVELSGYDLTTGHIVLEQEATQKISAELARSGNNANAVQREHQTRPQLYLTIIALCSLGIIGYSLRMPEEPNRVGMVAVGAFGLLGMLLMTFAAARDFGLDMPADVARMVRISHPIGFYIVIVAFMSSTVLSVLGIRGTSERSPARVTIDLPLSTGSGLPAPLEALNSEEVVDPTTPTNAFGEPLKNSSPAQANDIPIAASRICPSCGSLLAALQSTCGQCGRVTTPGT